MSILTRGAAGVLCFMLLDGLWLGLLMNRFYREQLAPIARLANGGFAPNWPAALAVYLCLGLGIATLVVPRATDAAGAAAYGAMFGLFVYGVYDFTNYSTLKDWPFALALVDLAWGCVASALSATAVWMVQR